jgi:cytochrome P450
VAFHTNISFYLNCANNMAIFTILFTVLALPVALFVWSASSLAANKAKAQSAGFPILVRWTTPINPLWLMTGSTIVKTCRALGIGTENFHRYYKFGWEANQRHLVHQETGPVFMLVTPGGNWLCVADAEVIQEVLHRRNEFTRNIEQMSVLNVYGSNISSTDGEDWQRHRKITAITFTENNNQLVWRQSLLQAKDMLKYWVEKQPIKTVNDDTKVFTLNVLAAALFNKVYPFEGATEPKSSQLEDQSYLYRDSLGRILANIIPIFIFGGEGLKAWWMPKSWKEAGEAVAVFRSYVSSLIEEERARLSHGTQNNQTLVASLVRACEQEKDEEKRAQRIKSGGSGRKTTLTEQEIISNLFVYAFAGNDTTAISLAHLLYDLAAHPESQNWIAEEIRHYLPDDDISRWDYSQCAKLKRCLAVVVSTDLAFTRD